MSGGQKDLENKLVRAIGNPHEQRFFRRSVKDDTRCSLRYALTFYVRRQHETGDKKLMRKICFQRSLSNASGKNLPK